MVKSHSKNPIKNFVKVQLICHLSICYFFSFSFFFFFFFLLSFIFGQECILNKRLLLAIVHSKSSTKEKGNVKLKIELKFNTPIMYNKNSNIWEYFCIAIRFCARLSEPMWKNKTKELNCTCLFFFFFFFYITVVCFLVATCLMNQRGYSALTILRTAPLR